MVELVVWKIGLRVLVRRGQVHPLLVGETGGGVGSEEENLPMDLVSLLTSSDYSSSFPSLDTHTDSQRNVVSKPFVPSPITSSGHLEPPKPFESVLNWQTQNARAQNDTLVNINSKVEKISLRTEQLETKVDSISAQMQQIHQNLQSRIGQLDSELRAMLAHRYNGPEFDQKEREIRRLKAELAQIESEKQRPTLFTSSPLIPSIGPTYHPFASMLSPIKQYDPSKLFGMTHTLFRDNPLPPPPKPKPKPRPQPRPPPLHPSSLTIPGQPSPTFTPTSPPAPLSVPAQSKDKEPMNQFTAHAVIHSSTDDPTSDSNLAVSDSHTETDSESSASTSDSEKSYADITKILMAQPDQGQTSHTEPYVDIPSEVEDEMPESSATNQPSPAQPNPPSQKSSNGPWFTFDDLPSHKWRDRLNEMSAWIDLQMLRTGATTQSVLREFATRFTGALRDWFDSLGQYRQLQFVDLPEVSSALAVLHDQFLGDPSAVFEAARRDYLNMKCCSLNAKDLDFHYKRMSLLFYKLNGFNEPTLKHVFLASLPEELQPDIQRQLTASNLSLDNISLGKIFQLAKTCLDKLCEQKQFFKELLKDKEPFRSACKKPYLQIKCHKKKDCDCSSKKKRHFRKFKTPDFSSKPRRSRKPYRFFRKKSSSSREFKRKQSSRCFICKRKGHYAKDCPNKREKAIRLVEHLQATTDYSPAKDELEFYFSEQDEPNDETVFALQNSSDSDSDQSQVIFHQQLLSLDTTVPIPSIKLQILPSKFQRPIPAIGLIDTGAQRSMLNPHILPPEYWTQSEEHFKAVNGKLFTTSLITKKSIGIQIFPNCVIWTKVIGSTLPNKDILLGFDILHQIKHLQIIPTEYSYIPESAQISESSYPLLSPYQLYKRPSSFTRSIRTLISTRRPHPKEYIQSSRLDQCALQATSAEQYVTLEIPSELLSNWKREGYTHLHLGGIRLILTLHGRKGLPVTARLAMLDTRFKQYQDAVIGTVLTTLHAGSVLLTFYPNFNLSLQDPNLPTTLKVQVQIQGAEQISSAKIATLHHQLVYRLQNHALDLPAPEHHSDTLMVLAESDQIPTIIQIPRQIPRHELIKLMPLEWISNYEQFHNNTAPIQTSEGMFERRHDGTVRMTFKPPPSAPQEPPRLSFTYSSMITAVQTAQEDLPITGFNSQGYPVYPAKHNGHFLWDAPGSGMCDPNCPCWDDWEEDDDYATTRKKKPKKKKPPVPCHHYDPKPPSDPPPPPAPLPIYRKELTWIAKHCKSEIPSPISNPTPPLACMMFSSFSSTSP
ncbi:hypothetical protein KPL70_021605 [Citrus sinensis]|nr:hypothetical protein KPL70_021605 [Citrus sinensis]